MKPLIFLKGIFMAIGVIIFTFVLLIFPASCNKEYSIEGRPYILPADSIPNPQISSNELPVCNACSFYPNPVNLNQWMLKAEQSQACGIIDTAITDLGRSYFTFFGPSSCSGDTGLVVTVYLENESLDRDRSNLTANRVAFYYYDRVTPSYIFITLANSPFTLHIDTYNHQTRLLSGRFSGSALRANGTGAFISEGKFKIRLL